MNQNKPRAPQNTTTRAERLAAWNAAHAAAQKYGPERVHGRDARYRWLDAIRSGDLSRTTRLVAHSLVRHGKVNGNDIFPGTRLLAREAGLSERTVCTHLNILVRRGFLGRIPRHGNTAGARGFNYVLNIPKVMTADPASLGPLVVRTRPNSVLSLVQHSAEARADSAEADDV